MKTAGTKPPAAVEKLARVGRQLALRQATADHYFKTQKLGPKIAPDKELVVLRDIIKELNPAGQQLVERALRKAQNVYGNQTRKNGRSCLEHLLDTSYILRRIIETKDAALIAAGILHDIIEDTMDGACPVTIEELRNEFGADVAKLVEDETKLSKALGEEKRDIESLKKWIIAIKADPRVALLKAADRLSNMRDQEVFPAEKINKHAVETLQVYVPIMAAMGVWEMRVRLEERARYYLNPAEYTKLLQQYQKEIGRTDELTSEFEQSLRNRMATSYNPRVEKRQRHLSEIIREMERNGTTFDQIMQKNPLYLRYFLIELQGLRGVCFDALELLYERALDDYTPLRAAQIYMGEARRPNNYEAIQVYFTKPGQPGDFLVTIATEEMNRVNRLGIAAQMLDDAWQRKSFDWLGRLVNIIQDAYSIEVARALVAEAGQTMRINQEEVDLPPGATALDYAFIKYPELALKADKVKVNNREVGLREVLKEGDQVQIIFDIRQHIKPAWLSCVRTIRAAEVIKKHLSQLSVEQQIEQGVAAINEVAELNYLSWADIEKTSELAAFIKARPELNLPKAAALPQAIGAGQINSQEIIKAFIEYYSRVLQERIADGQKHKRLISVRVTVPDIKKTLSQVADRISEFNINIGAALSVPIKVGADQAILLFDLPIFSSIQKAQVLNMLRKYPKSKGVKCRQIREAELARHVQMMLRYAATVQRN